MLDKLEIQRDTYKSPGILMYHLVVILDSFYQTVKNKIRNQVIREPLAKIQWLVVLGQLYKLNP